jgi:hypothetical protein
MSRTLVQLRGVSKKGLLRKDHSNDVRDQARNRKFPSDGRPRRTVNRCKQDCIPEAATHGHRSRPSAGDYAFEPAGETHTLIVPDDVQEMVTLFYVTGNYTYVDPCGVALGYEDVFTKLEMASRYYESIGLAADYVRRFVR